MHIIECMLSRLVMTNSFETLWTVAHQAPLSMGFPRQEYWSGLPFPSPGELPNPGIEPMSPQGQAFHHCGSTGLYNKRQTVWLDPN